MSERRDLSRDPEPGRGDSRRPTSARLRRLLDQASVEVSPRDGAAVVERLRTGFRAGTEVFVNSLPGGDPLEGVALAAGLRRAGFEPVLHMAARAFADPPSLDRFLAAAAGEAGVTRVLLLAGDVPQPAGPYASSLDVLRTGFLARHGIRRVGFAGHPEGHPQVARAIMDDALAAKVQAGEAAGHAVEIVTQFGFDAAAVTDWLRGLAAADIVAPVRLGVAGPASPATLVRYAIRCGIGQSLRTLQSRPAAIAKLFGDVRPDNLLHEILAAPAVAAVRHIHLFPFGGIEKTGAWLTAALAETGGP